MIKERKLRIPEEEESSFMVLAEQGIISKELSKRLREAKGMRNILSHQYGSIDDELVFESITKQLDIDVKEFIREIEKK